MGGKFWDTCSPWTTPPAQSLPTTVKPPMPCFSVKHLNLIQHPNFFLLIYFNRRLISLQYCGGFCMHWHQSATGVHVDPSWTPPHQACPSAPALNALFHASNLDWQIVSHMILYIFQCHSPKSSHPLPLPQSPKGCSIHLCLSCCLAYRVIITIFLNSIYMC